MQVRDVSKRYGRQWAVRHLDLELTAGGLLVVEGHNGAGKSTLLGLLGGAIRPTEGQIFILGEDLNRHSRRDQVRSMIATLPHRPFVYPDLTAREQLIFAAKLRGVTIEAERRERLLTRVGLQAAAHRRISTYSRGMIQRLALASLMVQEAPIWLLDEPSTGLDPIGRELLATLIEEALGSNKSVVLVSHSPRVWDHLATQRLALNGGRVKASSAEAA